MLRRVSASLRSVGDEFSYFLVGVRSTGGSSQLDRVRTYYEQCDFHYRFFCRDSWAMHYGIWQPGVKNHAEAAERMNEVMADAIGLADGEKVLDAGCGFGGSSFWLAERRNARVQGISIVPIQVHRAQRVAAARGLADRCRFSLRSYADTGFEPGCFDVCWFIESLCYAEDKPAVVAEAFRVLRPGGRLVIADGFRFRRPDAPNEEGLREFLAGWAVRDLDTPEELEQTVSASGFADFTFRDITSDVLLDARWLHSRARAAWPVARAFDRVGLIRPVQLANVRAALLQYETMQRGVWRYGLAFARRP